MVAVVGAVFQESVTLYVITIPNSVLRARLYRILDLSLYSPSSYYNNQTYLGFNRFIYLYLEIYPSYIQ